jgi:hypothetical protein
VKNPHRAEEEAEMTAAQLIAALESSLGKSGKLLCQLKDAISS